eukprot:GFUD01090238.1.p1 GENE.GFUD01090238.1~~GFUD01090238.1.p1  ORF type:complete len:118 (+),score=17.81 GFUD01090238.1:33-386(+)
MFFIIFNKTPVIALKGKGPLTMFAIDSVARERSTRSTTTCTTRCRGPPSSEERKGRVAWSGGGWAFCVEACRPSTSQAEEHKSNRDFTRHGPTVRYASSSCLVPELTITHSSSSEDI